MLRGKFGLIGGVIAAVCVAVMVIIAANVFGSAGDRQTSENRAELGLVTSLPIYWNEGDPFTQLADGDVPLPWVRAAIERKYNIRPIDVLAGKDDPAGESAGDLQDLERLVIIQPRGLSPVDNVALDDWVRAGGRLFYAIDPMLSGEYDVPIGDPRHPTITALVPPVLARWGLELFYEDSQSEAPFIVQWDDLPLVAQLPGRLSLHPQSELAQDSTCVIAAEGLIARCSVGEGQVTIMADAALFEPREGNDAAEATIAALLEKAVS